MLRTILEDPQLTVQDVIPQTSERNLYGRSVRLDALCTLGTGEKVNIEVQRSDNDDHLKRVRFNAASITVRESQAGDDYSCLPNVIVVYISEFDFFKGGRTIYHVDRVLRETGTVVDNGQKKIFVNTAVDDGTRISDLMNCFTKKQVMNRNFPALSEAVNRLKTTEGGLTDMSDILRSFVEEGKKEGILLGEKNGGIKMLYQLVNNHILSMDEAVKQSGVTEEEFLKIASQPSATV